MMLKKSLLLCCALILAACASNPASYIPARDKPIVNIEAEIDPFVKVDAAAEQLKITNNSEQPLNVLYKLFWYDAQGVTQSFDPNEQSQWENLWLVGKEAREIALIKPTDESHNYRIYVRAAR